jgi:predicted GIY-YIG superfamily endonuclease
MIQGTAEDLQDAAGHLNYDIKRTRSRDPALKREAAIKKLSRGDKLSLISAAVSV